MHYELIKPLGVPVSQTPYYLHLHKGGSGVWKVEKLTQCQADKAQGGDLNPALYASSAVYALSEGQKIQKPAIGSLAKMLFSVHDHSL